MNSDVYTKKRLDVRRLVVIGVLSGICIMLSITPLGFIPIGPVNATIMHIPVIIGAVIEGPIVGLAIGLIFGLTSLIRAFTMPTVTSFLMMNPIISVLPRVVMGFASYYIFTGIFKSSKNKKISAMITGFLASLINTVGVLGLIYLIYGQRYVEAIGQIGSPAKIITAIAVTNGLPEAILAGVIVSSVVTVIKK
ncbi:membrane protein [Peptostreptococcus russellii]|uniref:Membrane protein n=1 Tax=Peptostreptococcus russellii TaxID=215200 RepID=A0A2P7Q2W5_9FIRM|nr:ECF transporter S component [Peptostreptococcus russellii]PSJ32290.1 membrane protein [Peptostreptococcus russellii]